MDCQEQESAGFYVHCPVSVCMHECVLLAFFYFSKSPKLLACPFLMRPYFLLRIVVQEIKWSKVKYNCVQVMCMLHRHFIVTGFFFLSFDDNLNCHKDN